MATLRDDVSAVPILLPVGMAPSLYRVRLGLPSEQWQAEAERVLAHGISPRTLSHGCCEVSTAMVYLPDLLGGRMNEGQYPL